MAPAHLDRWLKQVKNRFPINGAVEFSLEINPESCSRELLQALHELGVNRPVLGVQSFDPVMLKRLGRKHDLNAVHEAIYFINTFDYASHGIDLLFGLPGQTAKMLSADLDQAVDLNPPHISFYQLTLEPGTEMHRQFQAGRLKMPDSDFARSLYLAGYEYMTESGYERYEVCSFAKPGHDCRHNLNYWTGGDYIGLGPSAHSFVDGRRYSNVASLSEYAEALRRGRRAVMEDKSGRQERMIETVMLGFRTARGIDRDRFRRIYDRPLEEFVNKREYDLLIKAGHLVEADGYVRLAEDSMLLADEVTRRLTS
jgi:oxygen-independent coproporphyrinogen-3 oxidase